MNQDEKSAGLLNEDMAGENLPSIEIMKEQAYLVGRGVRLLAIVGTIEDEPYTISEALIMLNEASVAASGSQERVPIPFLVKNPAPLNRITIGFASHAWVVDVYEWLSEKDVSLKMTGRILGLLLGYSGDAIENFENRTAGQRVPIG